MQILSLWPIKDAQQCVKKLCNFLQGKVLYNAKSSMGAMRLYALSTLVEPNSTAAAKSSHPITVYSRIQSAQILPIS